jgi:RHS repeat-associated protein
MGPFAIGMGVLGLIAGGAGAIEKNDSFAKAQAAADAAVLAIKLLCGKDPGGPPGLGTLTVPYSPNVLIGGFPCPPVGDMAFGGILKALKGVGRAARNKISSRRNNSNESNCGDPVQPVTGAVFGHYTDFVSTGLFQWRRYYDSSRAGQRGPLGHGVRHHYQRRLLKRLHRATFIDWEGNSVEFPRFERGSNVTRADGYMLERLAPGFFQLSRRGEPTMQFVGGEFDNELRFIRLLEGDAVLELEHDGLGRLVAAHESNARTGERRRFWLDHDDSGLLQQILEVDPNGERQPAAKWTERRVTYHYTEWGELEQAINGLGGRSQYQYDGFHRLTKQTDARDYSFDYVYDTLGRCTETRGEDGMLECRLEYFPEEGFTRLTEPGPAQWEFHYDTDGVVRKIVDPYGGEKLRELDGDGRLVLEVDSGGREIHWLYDEDDVHYARRDRFGHSYPPYAETPNLPNPLQHRVPHNALGWLFEGLIALRPDAVLGLAPRQLGNIPDDVKGYAQGCFRTRGSDLNAEAREPALTPRIQFDSLGNRVVEVDVRGRERRWEYDAEGHQIAERDREGQYRRQHICSWKSVADRVDGEGNVTRYEYSRREEVVAITDPLGFASRYGYDLKGRLVRVHRHGRVREEYTYDRGDHFIEKRNSQGRVLFTNTVHPSHFVGTRTLSSGGEHRYDYDARGRITEASTEAHLVQLHYDDTGYRLRDQRDGVGVQHRPIGLNGSFGRKLTWHTEVLERFELERDVDGANIRLRDPAGHVTRIEVGQAGLVTRHCSNGTSEVLQYDEEGRLEGRLCYQRDRFARVVGRANRYTYSAEGDLLQATDSLRGTTQYDVDCAHRLIGEHTPDGQNHVFYQDPAGNLLSRPGLHAVEVAPGNLLQCTSHEQFRFDERDHLSERHQKNGSIIRYTYDSFDLLRRIEQTEPTLTWPPRLDSIRYAETAGARAAATSSLPNHEPPSLRDGAIWQAAYDALGRRLWTEIGGRRREFYWDGDRLAAEIFPERRLRIYQYASPEALVPLTFTDYAEPNAAPSTGKTHHVFTDPVGMPLCIEDEQGKIVWWAQRIDPFGLIQIRPDAQLEYNLRWPGHYYDPETGLHYNRYRYYDPHLGRYLQSDPIGYQGSPVNLYAYCPNPLVHVDVLGLHDPADQNGKRTGPDDGEGMAAREGTGQQVPTGPNPARQSPTKTDRLKKHVLNGELDAARREAAGEVVARKPDGTPWDHVAELQDAQRGLVKQIGKLKKKLSDPALPPSERSEAQRELGEASRLLDKSEEFLPR